MENNQQVLVELNASPTLKRILTNEVKMAFVVPELRDEWVTIAKLVSVDSGSVCTVFHLSYFIPDILDLSWANFGLMKNGRMFLSGVLLSPEDQELVNRALEAIPQLS